MRILALLAIPLVLCGHAAAQPASQPFPAKPPKIYVGFVAGGGVDQTARITAAKLTELWGTQVLVENKVGAGGTLAADATAKSPADGYALNLCNIASHAIGPALYKKIPYDPLKDFTYIGLIGTTPNLFAVHPSLPVTSVAEFIAYAKANPGKLVYGSSGIGTSPHLSVELFKSMTGVTATHVPYKGGAQSSADLVAGQIHFVITNLPEQIGYVRQGRTRALGVSTTKRSPQLPDVPSISETVPGYEVTVWYALCGPAGLSASLVDRISADLQKAVASPDTFKRLSDVGVEPASPNTPDQFKAFAIGEIAKWAKVVKESGATSD